MRIAIAGGGTGGHVQPAVAVVQELRARGGPIEFLWIGSSTGIEAGAARALNVPFVAVQTGKLRRYFSLQTPIDAIRIPLGMLQAARRLRQAKIDAVYSTGGFVSVPAVVAARMLGIPVLTHEQTAIVGLANRINARFADVVAVSYESSLSALAGCRARLVVTGNPVRAEILAGDPARGRREFGFSGDLPLVYVTGGALGAQSLNRAVEKALPELLGFVAVLHQCGPAARNGDYPRLAALRDSLPAELKPRYAVREFLGPEVADAFAAASIVIGRAGASTVAELAALGKPSILIPLPGAGGDEQTMNASILAAAGGAILLPQTELTPERLVAEIRSLTAGPDAGAGTLDTMRAAAASVYRPGASARLADELLRLAERSAATRTRG